MHDGYVKDVYASLIALMKVFLTCQEYREKPLNKLPILYRRSLVQVVPQGPFVEYQAIPKRGCHVWLAVECRHFIMWPLLCLRIEKLGKLLTSCK